MRWKTHLFLQENHEGDIWKEDFGFKSEITPRQGKHKEEFAKKFLDMMSNIKFRPKKDTFQKKLKEDIPKMKQSPNVFVFTNKTSNIYEMPEQ